MFSKKLAFISVAVVSSLFLATFLFSSLFIHTAHATNPAVLGPATPYPTGISFSIVAETAGDFNRDGKPDIAVINSNGAGSVLLSNGDGTFQSPKTFLLNGYRQLALAVGDINGDTNLDLVASDDLGNVTVLLGNGDGTFKPNPVKYAIGSSSQLHSIVVGDFNGDHKPDLAVVSASTDLVYVLLNNGDGTFLSPQTFVVGTNPVDLKTQDLNGDGKLDLVVVNQSDNTISVLMGRGDGTFQFAVNYSTGQFSSPQSVAIGDFNGDGKLDLAVACTDYPAYYVSIFLSNGDGSFQNPNFYPAGSGPIKVATGDFNGDGKLDLVTINNPTSRTDGVGVLLGNGNGTFRDITTFSPSNGPYSVNVPTDLVIADFNGDGKPDVAILAELNNNLILLLNQPLIPATTYTYYLPFLANAYIPQSGNAGSFTTFLTFQNIGSNAANVTLKYLDASGLYVATPSNTCTVVARLGECLPVNPFAPGTKGTGILTSTQPLNVVVSEATPYGGSAYAVSEGGNNSLVVPIALNGAYGDFSTQITIFNGGQSAANNIKVTFYDNNGNQQYGAGSSLSLNAYASTTLDQAASNSGLRAGFAGWAQISNSDNSVLLVAQVLEQSPERHFVAIANAQATNQTTLYAPAMFNNAYGGFKTAANLVNPNSVAVTVSVTYYNLNGTAYPAVPFSLSAHNVAAFSQSGTNAPGIPIGGLPNGFAGAAIVTSSNGGVVMVVNESGGTAKSGTYVAAADPNGRVGLPVMANGGYGYTTGATVFNSSNQTISCNIQYYDVGGAALGGPQTFSINPYSSKGIFQGNAGVGLSYGTAVVIESTPSGSQYPANDLIVTTNAQSDIFFYTYTEPNSPNENNGLD